jgi:hypothetical protein
LLQLWECVLEKFFYYPDDQDFIDNEIIVKIVFNETDPIDITSDRMHLDIDFVAFDVSELIALGKIQHYSEFKSLDDSQCFISGNVKWDGCVNFKFNSEVQHSCGFMGNFINMLTNINDILLLSHYGTEVRDSFKDKISETKNRWRDIN